MTTSLIRRVLPVVSLFLFTACGSSSGNDVTTEADLHGNEATSTSASAAEGRALNFEDFTEVSVESGMRVDIQQDEGFNVHVTGSDEALEELKIEQEGDRLRFFFDRNFIDRVVRWEDNEVNISIQMPELAELDLSSGASGMIDMDMPDTPFEADISSGARLDGIIEARSVSLDLSSGSHVTLDGKSDEVILDGSSGSEFDLGQFGASQVTAELSSGSDARVMTDGTINADLSSGGHLRYEGNPRLGEIDMSSGGTIERAD